jgi:2-polyprenyl-6-methoxyphenol hydroxylase-like FAD-dependent oxidoreductase
MARVVIAGAGFAGLAGALFLARRGHDVSVVERDDPPPDGTPADDANGWRHPGVPQARQSHALLGRARRVLFDEAPDVVEALLARGVHEIPVIVGAGRLPGERMLLSRRLVAEAELRRIVGREPGVNFIARDAVVDLCMSRRSDIPVVTGAHLSSGAVLDADLVVDAGGRRSALPDWFTRAGLTAPFEERQDCGFFYLTRFYRVRPGCETPISGVPASVQLDYATVFALGADNDTFSLTVTLSVDDPCRIALRRPDRFEAFLDAVPHSAPWIRAGEPISEISIMSRIENRRRRLTLSNGPIAGGIVSIGDAALHTNPTLGRGISMGLCHAQHLADVAHFAPDDPVSFVDAFSAWTDEHLGVWYDTQVAADANTLERLAAGLRNERLAPLETPAARFAAAAFLCARHDEVVGAAVARMAHLFDPPATAFSGSLVAARISEFLATGVSLERPPDNPSRAAFEKLVT